MRCLADSTPRPSSDLLNLARRFHPEAVSFTSYVTSLNETLGHPFKLSSADDPPRFSRLLQNLYIVPPSAPPKNCHESIHTTIPIDQVLANVIASILRSTNAFTAHKSNVLTAGFFLAREEGAASILRDLDARSPSAPLQNFRSPSWRLLYRRIGHSLLRHLLLHATILLAVTPSNGAAAFLQLCGPVATANDYPQVRRLPRNASNVIMRRDVLYRDSSRPRLSVVNGGLPAENHLHRIGTADASTLLRIVFPTLHRPPKRPNEVRLYDTLAAIIHKTRTLKQRKLKRLRPLLPIFKSVLQRVRRRSFRRLLGIHCPIEFPANASTAQLIEMNTKPRRVANFLTACVRQILALDLFGSARNLRIVERAIHQFVRNRLRNESFDIRRYFCEAGLIVTDVTWLRLNSTRRVANPTDLKFRQARLHDLLVWLFRGILIPLLQQNFYVTEGALHRNRIFYFRNEVWKRLSHPGVGRFPDGSGIFSSLTRDEFAACTARREAALSRLVCTGLGSRLGPNPVLYYHHLRQMPKKASMRGIQRPRVKLLQELKGSIKRMRRNESRKQQTAFKLTLNIARSVTKSLINSILRVLLAETRSRDGESSASVFNLKDIYARFIELKKSWLGQARPPMYACCVDISKSFDTIPLETLFSEVVPAVFSRDRYVLLRYRLSQPDVSTRLVKHRFAAHVCESPGEETSFTRLMRDELCSSHRGAVFSDLSTMTTMSTSDMLAAMKEFLMNNIVVQWRKKRTRVDSGFMVQTRGLPQGHQLSPLLTALFYRHVEKQDLSSFFNFAEPEPREHSSPASLDSEADSPRQKPANLLMRFIDDTMFLTSSKEQAINFVQRMAKGWKASHGFCINIEKTRTSFTADKGGSEREVCFPMMPWCGLLVDLRSMEIRADYTRYKQERGRLRDFIAVEHDFHPGRALAERALICFNPKIHAVLLDSQINSWRTVAVNLYQAAVISCLKLCSYVTEVRPKRVTFFCSIVKASVENFANLVMRSVSNQAALKVGCRFQFSSSEVKYMSTHAYHITLQRKLACKGEHRDAAKECIKSFQTVMQSFELNPKEWRNARTLAAVEQISLSECQELWTIPL